jgi:hypothetical protein
MVATGVLTEAELLLNAESYIKYKTMQQQSIKPQVWYEAASFQELRQDKNFFYFMCEQYHRLQESSGSNNTVHHI